jgi:isoquinoline 1-oxidoreductase beta subunit
VNPDIIRSQVESAIIYGLGAATKAAVLIEDGAVVQSNFHDLPVLRMSECPLMEVYIVDSEESPTGIGEISLPPVAPALANAIFKATGQRLREMPLRLS